MVDSIKTFNKKNKPKHIAIIMDGNGRWASDNNQKRVAGHRKGVETVKDITKHCVKLDIKYLTLYTFSNENWSRPKSEILALMNLLVKTLDVEIKMLLNNNIKFNVFGDLDKLDIITKKKLSDVIDKTKLNSGLQLNLAISYGSRQEIVCAINKILNADIIREIDEKCFNDFLYTSKFPDPDLLIRTGGEYRISNFLLWQIAYSEIYFSKLYWPDFNTNELDKAICDYSSRERRYGQTSEQLN